MKKIILFSILIIVTSNMIGQDWQTDFDTSKEIASKENKPIILVFQGSDWCAPCIKLEREIWSSDEFISYSKDNFVMLLADFPRKKKNALDSKQQDHNNSLAEKYNKNGYFPYVVILDKDGKVLGATDYKKVSPTEYINILESFK